jgi:hypothetical protein
MVATETRVAECVGRAKATEPLTIRQRFWYRQNIGLIYWAANRVYSGSLSTS